MKQETFTDIEYTFRLYAMFTCANLYALAIAGRKLSTTCYRGSLPFFGKRSGKRSMNGCILLHFAAIFLHKLKNQPVYPPATG